MPGLASTTRPTQRSVPLSSFSELGRLTPSLRLQDTASEDGMLNLLPVYLDHIFSPTLRDSGFTTEVFNVNGEGHEGGVVYSEMQGRQGSSDDELELRIQQVLYDNRNGYRSETGGRLDALRHLKLADSKLSARVPAL